MAMPKHFRPADFGGDVDAIQNSQCKRIYRAVTIEWSRPVRWNKGESAPIPEAAKKQNCLYCLVRDHHLKLVKSQIMYVGITKDIGKRFYNSPKAKRLTEMRGETRLSIGSLHFDNRRKIDGTRANIEAFEHLLIWTLWPKLNERKVYTLPGMGKNPTTPWHVSNTGYRFGGVMPREIAYPWILVKPGRNRSLKVAS